MNLIWSTISALGIIPDAFVFTRLAMIFIVNVLHALILDQVLVHILNIHHAVLKLS